MKKPTNFKKLPDKNTEEQLRLIKNFERRLKEMRQELDDIYKEAKVRNLKRIIAEN